MIIVTTTTGAQSIKVYEDDEGAIATLNFKAVDENGDAIDIFSYTITIRAVDDDDTGANEFNGTCTLVGGGTGGLFKYIPIATDFNAPGDYLVYFIFAAAGEQATVKFGPVKVITGPSAT